MKVSVFKFHLKSIKLLVHVKFVKRTILNQNLLYIYVNYITLIFEYWLLRFTFKLQQIMGCEITLDIYVFLERVVFVI